ncbi:hypothetical protein BCY91_06815 [Pelobium manganitolerans]|uniref:DNA 3'-5' helicase II n=1 Tax=Pelobium manganitolerans TaxID=1842495 RepID=A0A419S568_9SPHI|nr:UvrD-helicase domain-containing protein [Pelobium manganitolerans]RKD15217.1 hypothetical protein BCY91_06815 [Pelobium manganitolerans]
MEENKKKKILYKISRILKCKLETLSNLSDEQVFYINFYCLRSSFLDACPGSGKTEVLSLKCCLEVLKWRKNSSGIALLTFTKSAASELTSRIGKFNTTISYPHFVGTFDSWLHAYILQPYCHDLVGYGGKNGDKSIRIIEDDKNAYFLANYSSIISYKGKTLGIRVTQYHFTSDWKEVYSYDEKFDVIVKSVSEKDFNQLKEQKLKFIKDGFATYTDAECLCENILTRFSFVKRLLAKRFPVIYIDECQDLSEFQLRIIEGLQDEGVLIHCVGDPNQAIYKFRKVDPSKFLNFVSQSGLQILKLSNNYRSNQAIVSICRELINSRKEIVACRSMPSHPATILWEYTENDFGDLPKRFSEFLTANDLDVNKSAILARGKNTLSYFNGYSENYNLNNAELLLQGLVLWTNPSRRTEDLDSALQLIGRALCNLGFGGLGNRRNQFCPDGIRRIIWRNQIAILANQLKKHCPLVDGEQPLKWSQWIKLLKIAVREYWSKFKYSTTTYEEIKLKLRVPNNCGEVLVTTTSSRRRHKNSSLRATTIHSVKGETLDAVLLVSHRNKSSKGGHHSDWIEGGSRDEEHVRFAYVACSRPKHLLVLATPKLRQVELANLIKLGFQTV